MNEDNDPYTMTIDSDLWEKYSEYASIISSLRHPKEFEQFLSELSIFKFMLPWHQASLSDSCSELITQAKTAFANMQKCSETSVQLESVTSVDVLILKEKIKKQKYQVEHWNKEFLKVQTRLFKEKQLLRELERQLVINERKSDKVNADSNLREIAELEAQLAAKKKVLAERRSK